MTKARKHDPPADMKPAAAARWRAVYGQLRKRGPVDLEALRQYCQVWSRWREAEDGLEKAGSLARGTGGRIVPSPLLTVAERAGAQVRDLERRLGIGAGQDDAAAGGLLTRRELADQVGVHPMTVVKWEQDGMPVAKRGARGRASLYDPQAVAAWKDARDAAAAVPKGKDVAGSVIAERARKLRLENDAREGRLVPLERVKREAFDGARTIRDSMLNLPDRLAGELAADTDPTVIWRKLDAAIREALASAADTLAGAVH